MTWLFEDEMRQGLRRLAFGLQVRIVLAAVGMPLWVWAVDARHPVQAWIEAAFWLLCPVTDLIMAWGAHRLGARAGSVALIAAGLINLYAALIGFSGSEIGRGQVPFAMSLSEIVGLIGVFSSLAYLRGPAEDAQRAALARRIYRAMILVAVSLACVSLVRAVMWQGFFAGLAALIVASAVVMLVIMALLDVVGVFRLAERAKGVDQDDPRPARRAPRRDHDPQAPDERRPARPRRAVGGYHADRFGPPTDPPEPRPTDGRSTPPVDRRRPQLFDDEDPR